jgi:type II secretory pathway pseudopilin PulG
VESLLTLAFVAILTALLLPSLGRTREVAREAASLSNLRQHALVFELYSTDYEGAYPCVLSQDCEERPATIGGVPMVVLGYFSQYQLWSLALANAYYGTSVLGSPFRSPRRAAQLEPAWTGGGYWYSSAFLADPRYWRYASRTGREQWRATRNDEVSYPSRKCLHWEAVFGENDWRNERHLLGFVDGSARKFEPASILPQYSFGTCDQGCHGGPTRGLPGLATIDGVRVRDVN